MGGCVSEPVCRAEIVGQKDDGKIRKMLLKHQIFQGGGFQNDFKFYA